MNKLMLRPAGVIATASLVLAFGIGCAATGGVAGFGSAGCSDGTCEKGSDGQCLDEHCAKCYPVKRWSPEWYAMEAQEARRCSAAGTSRKNVAPLPSPRRQGTAVFASVPCGPLLAAPVSLPGSGLRE
jgi:hypothetical protein